MEVQTGTDPFGMYGKDNKVSQSQFDIQCLEKANEKASQLISAIQNKTLTIVVPVQKMGKSGKPIMVNQRVPSPATYDNLGIYKVPPEAILGGRGMMLGSSFNQQELNRLLQLKVISQQGNDYNIHTNKLKPLYTSAVNSQKISGAAKGVTNQILSAPTNIAKGFAKATLPQPSPVVHWQNQTG